jgi:hypothetical protein
LPYFHKEAVLLSICVLIEDWLVWLLLYYYTIKPKLDATTILEKVLCFMHDGVYNVALFHRPVVVVPASTSTRG